jgi:hypothetical protein
MSIEQTIVSQKTQLEHTLQLEEKQDRYLNLRKKHFNEIQTANAAGDVVEEAIFRGTRGLGEFGIDKTHFTPKVLQKLRQLHSLGYSKANLDLEFTGYLHTPVEGRYDIIQNPDDLEISCPFSGLIYKGGSSILDFVKHKLPAFEGKKVCVVQGSATKPCHDDYDIELGTKLAKERKILITGGTGLPGSVMDRVVEAYLKAQGDGLLCATPESLMDVSAIHSERASFMDDNNQVLPEYKGRAMTVVTKNLPQRMGFFQYAANQSEIDNGIFVGLKGGSGTKHEKLMKELMEKTSRDLGTYGETQYCKSGLWND